jgi:phospholipase A1/A2
MRLPALVLGAILGTQVQAAPEWILAAAQGRALAGERFELIVVSAAGAPLPEELELRLRGDTDERVIPIRATAPAQGQQRTYAGTLPPGISGPVTLDLAGRASSVLVLLVGATREYEAPLSENDPMYFVVGAREGWSARFQLSFKYRLFDLGTGFGREQPWLSGFYFGYTQTSLWDLSSESRAFRDTSYRPSFFWKWERSDEKTFVDALRLGIEHESNGRDGPRSRSFNTVFVRPEWHWRLDNGHELQLTPKLYGYFDQEENPDIDRYRGHVDWRLRYDAAAEWIATAVARVGTKRKGSLLLDLSRRARDLRFGPVGGYFHLQYFNGYGEDILDYNVRRKSQLRLGFAIVP